MTAAKATTGRARRRGRNAGIIVFATIVTAFTAVCAIQIIIQVWAPDSSEATVECRPGVQGLLSAVRRARRAAASENGTEREAMARFRAALQPEWASRPALEERCQGDAEGLRALVVVERLRYAEEHAVRYEAVDLARLRRRVASLEPALSHPAK